jgi:hypothetical protein
MTNQPNRDLIQQAHDLDEQQLETLTGGLDNMPNFDEVFGDKFDKDKTVLKPGEVRTF